MTTHMIDVGLKDDTQRVAVAQGTITMRPETVAHVCDATLPKGNALETSRVAAIMAAKNTPQLIPLCHPLLLSGAECDFQSDVAGGHITVTTKVKCVGKTGVEMEALAACCAALLTLYDMTKGIDDTLELRDIRLMSKTGGKSGDFHR